VLKSFDLSPFATGQPLPTPATARIARDIDEALCVTGFLLVDGHGVGDRTRVEFFDAMRRFFALPSAEKEAIAIGNSSCHRGYVGFGAELLDGVVGDLKETLDIGIEHGPDHPEVVAGTPLHGPNQWPVLPGFRAAVDAYRTAMIEAVLRMQRAMSMALGLDPMFIEDQPGEPMYHVRLIHYPPAETTTPAPGQLGCGVHTDYGTLTLLADDGRGGLQVQERSGEWVDVIVPPGKLVVNLGDLMAIWTNDRWVSNPHRVVNPAGVHRYSSAFFVEPSFHLRIEAIPTCVADGEAPRHEPLVTGHYLLSRFDGTHSYRNELLR
jgi:isopenicillin N synthase-like dioxygenase